MHQTYDKNIIEKYIEDGMLIRQWHDDLDLQIINYTKKCEFEKFWNDTTKNCRGVVLDKNYNLVFPCITKFFNYDQLSADERKEVEEKMNFDTIITKKYDGCYGAIFIYDGQIVCTSRGSFNSFVTKEMYKMIKEIKNINKLSELNIGLVVEVICPETRILVNYGNIREFRVITAFRCDRLNNEFYELSFDEMKNALTIINENDDSIIKPVEDVKMNFYDLRNWQRTHDWTEEGFVVRLSDNYRIKFKSEDYLRVAAAKAYLNPINILNNILSLFDEKKDWILYENKKWVDKMKEDASALPDELYDEYLNYINDIENKVDILYDNILKIKNKYDSLSDKDLNIK